MERSYKHSVRLKRKQKVPISKFLRKLMKKTVEVCLRCTVKKWTVNPLLPFCPHLCWDTDFMGFLMLLSYQATHSQTMR